MERRKRQLHCVSIPHRYDQNWYIEMKFIESIEFQFLIGTIKTIYVTKEKVRKELFQFLIGTIKTRQAAKVLQYTCMFQFLIGTIKTRWCIDCCCSPASVSIPHRYDQNLVRPMPEQHVEDEFQFLIGTIKTPYRFHPHFSKRQWFQFLIGTIKTDYEFTCECPHCEGFNSS